jgi:plasmid stabilization system protein ParE
MKIVWADSAVTDYERLIGFIAEESPNNARLVQERIRQTIGLLRDFQFRQAGPLPDTFRHYIQKTSYFVIYRLPDAGNLEILGFFHAARDWTTFDNQSQ